jgi:energy-coupling factor transport system ATP-binding protein
MLIQLRNISHIYNEEYKVKALDNVNLDIEENEFIGLIGHTGSGKSTLVQLINGLIKPSSGEVIVEGLVVNKEKVNLKKIRQKIGLVFQYPEHQLFEEDIFSDVAFGPRNLDLSENEVKQRVIEALNLVGLDYEEYKDRSPFNLSGGQQRKVAIAGVLAMKPQVLILDEPSAGLDPRGRDQLLNLLYYLNRELKITLILISHRMEEIAQLASRVVVMDHGRLVFDGTPKEVFSQVDRIRELALDLPQITEILWKLKKEGFEIKTDIFTIPEAVAEILTGLRRQG